MAKNDKIEDKNSNQNELIQFRCTSDLKESLMKLAEKEGLNISKYVRMLAEKKVSLSKRQAVTPNANDTVIERNEWNMKAIQEVAMVAVFIAVFFLFMRFIGRLF